MQASDSEYDSSFIDDSSPQKQGKPSCKWSRRKWNRLWFQNKAIDLSTYWFYFDTSVVSHLDLGKTSGSKLSRRKGEGVKNAPILDLPVENEENSDDDIVEIIAAIEKAEKREKNKQTKKVEAPKKEIKKQIYSSEGQ